MVSNTAMSFTLCVYFAINLALSISNKHTLNSFPYPWTITALHAATTYLGSRLFVSSGAISHQPRYSKPQVSQISIFLFSSLFTINIAVSNLSLNTASLAFHQVVRSTAPIVVICIQRFWFKTRYMYDVHLAVLLMCVGVALTTAGDFYITTSGFLLTMLGTVLASIKTLATNSFLTGEHRIPPHELLKGTSQLAALQSLLLAYLAGEINDLLTFTGTRYVWIVLSVNIVLAFLQNTFSFKANKAAGPLTMTVIGNLKQIATIVVGMITFKTKTSFVGGIGMVLAVAGSVYYSSSKSAMIKPCMDDRVANDLYSHGIESKATHLEKRFKGDSMV